MGNLEEQIQSLENILVRQFRACQSLFALTRDERTALVQNNITNLMKVVEEKEACLDELGRLEDSRRMLVQEIAGLTGQRTHSPVLKDIYNALEKVAAGRLERLETGIQALIQQVRELNQGNQALARVALEWVDAAQTFMLNLYQPPAAYRPPHAAPATTSAVPLELDHRA